MIPYLKMEEFGKPLRPRQKERNGRERFKD